MSVELTSRQEKALNWLRERGKASARAVRRAGFSAMTLDALVEAGLAERTNLYSGGFPAGCVYRAVNRIGYTAADYRRDRERRR